jgi:hypothetical protein
MSAVAQDLSSPALASATSSPPTHRGDASLSATPASSAVAELPGQSTHVVLTLPGDLLETLVERVAHQVTARLERTIEAERRSPWVTTRELAEYSGWGESTVEKLSAANRIPGKVVHDGKVRFHLPTFDDWLLREHQTRPRSMPG